MSSADDQEVALEGGPTTNIRLHIRASNLPKSILNQQPDTLARISLYSPQQSGNNDVIDDVTHAEENGDSSLGHVLDETEIVYKSSNPRWTASFSAEYEYGSQLLFFVDIFAVRSNIGGGSGGIVSASLGKIVNKRSSTLLGRAVFDVQDVLGSKNNIKAKRLRNAGVVYALIEQQQSMPTSPVASRSLSSSSTSIPSDNQILNLRIRADSLIHVNSVRSRVAPKTIISKPDTYYEISRPSLGTWIVMYRSPTVKESVSPMWDEATIDLSSFHSSSPSSHPGSPGGRSFVSPGSSMSAFRLMITVYKVKRRKCKEIGSFETTIESLINAYQTMAKVTGYEDENVTKQSPLKTFQLRPSPTGGVDRSDIMTGRISIVKASIASHDEAWTRSKRFLSDTNDDDESSVGNKSLCDMKDDDTSEASLNQVLPLQARPKFADYVKNGSLDIDFCVAIDFTSSNGDPRIPGTLHYSRHGMMNDYEEAIAAIGNTIEKYSSTKEYPVWGFGAKYDGAVRHIFQCGDRATATGTEGILDAYRTVFETDLIMSGPTIITSVLKTAAARSKQFFKASPAKTNKYCVLLILTDGIVTDLQSTRDLVQSYRDIGLPLSVIVVGIGRADFSLFHEWSHAPSDMRGRFRFVEFREHQFDPDTLARLALETVPQDVVNYFMRRNIVPNEH